MSDKEQVLVDFYDIVEALNAFAGTPVVAYVFPRLEGGPTVSVMRVAGRVSEATKDTFEAPGVVPKGAVTLVLDGDTEVTFGEGAFDHAVFDRRRLYLDVHVVGAVIAIRPLGALFTEEEKRRMMGEFD